jgi:Sulfotransferase family
MPLCKISGKLVYFAHVPKCGGSAIEKYLTDRFGALALVDNAFLGIPLKEHWCRTSPQHLPTEAFSRLFPPGFFDAVFAVVRHPVERMISEYHYLRERHNSLPLGLSFSSWLKQVPGAYMNDRWACDNHLRPMADIVPEGAKVFRYEDGLDQVIPYIDALAGNNDGPRKIEVVLARTSKGVRAVACPEDLHPINMMYHRDFTRFGYVSALTGPSPLANKDTASRSAA